MPGVKVQARFVALNERWLARTGSCLLVSGAAIGTFQGLIVMEFGNLALLTVLWRFSQNS
jgi:hypothetical protein